MQLAIPFWPHNQTNLSPNIIHVLLSGGTYDHYIVTAPMLAPFVEIDGEQYVRTEKVAGVKIKDRFGKRLETYRVYRKENQ